MNENIRKAQELTALQLSVNFTQKHGSDRNMQHNLNDTVTLKGILANAAREAITTLRSRTEALQASGHKATPAKLN